MTRFATALVVLLVAVGGWACSADPHNPAARLAYTLRFVPGSGVEIEARFTGLRPGHTRLRLMSGWGGLQDQAAHLAEFTAVDGAGHPLPLARTGDGTFAVWEAKRDPGGELRLTYVVRSRDANVSPEATFVEAERAVALGYSIFPVPTELTDYLPVPVTVTVAAPEGWPVWASWPEGAGEGSFAPGTVHELWSGFAAAGRFRASSLSSERAGVTVLTEGDWTPRTGLGVANRLLPVLDGMAALFGRAPKGDRFRVLALFREAPVRDGRGYLAGVKEENAFLCLATPDRYADETTITAVAVHECLHFYIGGVLTAEPEPPYQNSPDMIWFFEGLVEYLTYRLMHEEGVISAEQLAAVERAKWDKLESRGHGTVSLAQAARSLDDLPLYEAVYTKGYLVGQLLDRSMELRCGEGALDELLRDLCDRFDAYRTGRRLTPETLVAAFDEHCPGTARMLRRYAEGNAPLPAAARPDGITE